MATNKGFGLFKRGQDEPILASGDADLLQRTRKREYGNDPAYKVAPLDSDVTFPEPPEPESSTAGLEQRMADARQHVFEEQITKAAREEAESQMGETISDAEEQMDELPEQPSDETAEESSGDQATDNTEGELKGEALADRAAELEIEGRSGMNADELREAVAKAEAEQD